MSEPKIAIIGGGLGGAATSYFLNELFRGKATIDLYERNAIGGRTATVEINGLNYENGAYLIHPSNKYMSDFISLFGLHKKQRHDTYAIFDGEQYLFRNSTSETINKAKLFWRYGRDAYTLNSTVQQLLDKLSRIYETQSRGICYKDVRSFLEAIDPDAMAMNECSLSQWLKGIGIGNSLINELILASTRLTYTQKHDIPAMAGLASLVILSPGLFSVQEGSLKLVESFFGRSKAKLIEKYVEEVEKRDSCFIVKSTTQLVYQKFEEKYDIVVLAIPLSKNSSALKFKNISAPFLGEYKQIFCTVVDGDLNEKAVKFPQKNYTDMILTVNPALNYYAIFNDTPISMDQKVVSPHIWKIYSSKELSNDELDDLFTRRSATKVTLWSAYPQYNSKKDYGKFEIHPGLYYLNAIEWTGSAMEKCVMAAKNSALLAYNYWNDKINKNTVC